MTFNNEKNPEHEHCPNKARLAKVTDILPVPTLPIKHDRRVILVDRRGADITLKDFEVQFFTLTSRCFLNCQCVKLYFVALRFG